MEVSINWCLLILLIFGVYFNYINYVFALGLFVVFEIITMIFAVLIIIPLKKVITKMKIEMGVDTIGKA